MARTRAARDLSIDAESLRAAERDLARRALQHSRAALLHAWTLNDLVARDDRGAETDEAARAADPAPAATDPRMAAGTAPTGSGRAASAPTDAGQAGPTGELLARWRALLLRHSRAVADETRALHDALAPVFFAAEPFASGLAPPAAIAPAGASPADAAPTPGDAATDAFGRDDDAAASWPGARVLRGRADALAARAAEHDRLMGAAFARTDRVPDAAVPGPATARSLLDLERAARQFHAP